MQELPTGVQGGLGTMGRSVTRDTRATWEYDKLVDCGNYFSDAEVWNNLYLKTIHKKTPGFVSEYKQEQEIGCRMDLPGLTDLAHTFDTPVSHQHDIGPNKV